MSCISQLRAKDADLARRVAKSIRNMEGENTPQSKALEVANMLISEYEGVEEAALSDVWEQFTKRHPKKAAAIDQAEIASKKEAIPEIASKKEAIPESAPQKDAIETPKEEPFTRYEIEEGSLTEVSYSGKLREAKVVNEKTGSFKVGLTTIKSFQDALHVIAPLRKNAQEQMLAIVLGRGGKLLQVIKHTSGTSDSSTVDPGMLAGAIHGVPGAKTVYFAHNHPSGIATQSQADHNITDNLEKLLKGTGINVEGMIVTVAGKRGSYYQPGTAWVSFDIEPTIAARKKEVPITERKIVSPTKIHNEAITGPDKAKRIVLEIADGRSGVVLVDNQHRPVAFVELSEAQMLKLRGKGSNGAADLLRKIHETNARAMFGVDPKGDVIDSLEAGRNLASFAQATGNTRMLDYLAGDVSLMERGYSLTPKDGNYFSMPKGVEGGLKVSQVLKRLSKKQKELLENGTLEIVHTTSELPAEVLGTYDKASVNFIAEGLYKGDNDKIYIVADGVTEQTLPKTLAHEAFHRAIATDKKLQAAYEKFKDTIENRFNLARDGKGSKTELTAYQRVIDGEVDPEAQVEEFMAYMITEYVNRPESFSQSVQRAIRDFLAAIKVALVRAGVPVDIMGELKPADFAAMSRYGWNLSSGQKVNKSIGLADYRQRMDMFSDASEAARRAYTEPLTKGPRPDSGVSVNVPIAVGTTKDAMKTFFQADIAAYKEDQSNYDKNTEKLKTYPNFRPVKGDTNDKITARMIKHIVDNLLWLHDLEDADVRERSKKWYEGARRLADHYAQKFGISPEVAAAVIATQSPQTEWFTNISKAERIMDIWSNQQDFVWSKEMTKTAARIYGKKEFAAYIAAIKGKKLSELADDNTQRAMWIRTYDESHNNNFFREISPEGYFLGYGLTGKSERTKNAWGSNAEIAKGIAILKNPTIGQISMELGSANKVRSFYNNIIAPNSKYGDVTIDTHAGAAGWVRPLSANDEAVGHYFDKGAISIISGNRGVYAVLAEAYRQAAAQRGLLPREMQSIAWESVRGLFPEKFKAVTRPMLDVNGEQVFDKKGKKLNIKVNLEKVDAIWEKYKKGKITQEQARSEIYELATKNTGGYQKPAWYGRPSGEEYASDGDSTYTGELPSPSLSERGTGSMDTGAGRATSSMDAEPGKFSKVKDPRKTIAKGRVQLFANGVTQTYNPIPGTSKAGVKQSFRAGEELIKLARKSGVDAPIMDELVSSPANTMKFVKSLEAIKQSSKFGSSVYIYPSEKYNEMRLFLARDGKSGFALKKDPEDGKVDIVSVFSTPDAPKGRAYTMLALATQEGGNKLDAFDTVLPDIYKAAGFKESWRMAWDNEYRPEGWAEETYKAYDEGHPDVVGFNFDPKYDPFKVSNILVSISDTTNKIPEIDALRNQLAGGDLKAGAELRKIGHAALDYMTSGIKSAVVTYDDATGLYGGEVEASLGLSVRFEEGDKNAVLKSLAEFSKYFKQEQFHVLGKVEKGTKLLHDYGDGSYNTRFYDFGLKNPLERAEIESIINESGLYGLTATDEHLTSYFVQQDPNDDTEYQQWLNSVTKVQAILGDRGNGKVRARTERLWVYGDGATAIPYDSITGQFRPNKNKKDQGVRFSKPGKNTITIDGVVRSAINNEGKPIALTDAAIKNFYKWFGDSKVVDDEGRPLQVYHGTPNDFSVFDRNYSNSASDLGAGFYFSNTTEDVGSNYAGFGPDLQNKIDNLAERLQSDSYGEGEELDWDTAREMATQQLAQHEGASMPVYLKMENPVVIGGTDETFFDYQEEYDEETEEYGEPTGTIVDLVEAIRNIDTDRFGVSIDEHVGDIFTAVESTEGITASRLINVLKDTLIETEDYETGEPGVNEIIRQLFEELGYDGFIDNTVDEKFGSQKRIGQPMKGMNPDTVHYIVNKPNQIKSSIGNTGEFSSSNTDIRYSKPARVSFYSELQRSVAQDKIPKAAYQSAQNLKQWLSNPGNLGKIGVKADEVYWSGLNDWLDLHGKGEVRKADVNMFLLKKGVYPKDIVLRDRTDDDYEKYDKAVEALVEKTYELNAKGLSAEEIKKDPDYKRLLAEQDAADEAMSMDVPESQLPKYADSEYVVPGGKNAKEIIVEVPAFESFKTDSSHYGDISDKQVGWVRLDTRSDAEGNDGTFINEIQSKRSMEGREKGFKKKGVVSLANNEAVSPAPFVTDRNNKPSDAYIALMLKKAVASAIEAGHGWVAWTRGDQQADFYKLSQKVKEIEVNAPKSNGTKRVTIYLRHDPTPIALDVDKEGVVQKGTYRDKNLADIIGKEAAKNILNPFEEAKTIPGEDLDITPKWTSEMYGDENGNNKGGKASLIKQAAMDIAKKMGGEVGQIETELDIPGNPDYVNSKQPALIITPAMAEKIGREGMSLFSKPSLQGVKDYFTQEDRTVNTLADMRQVLNSGKMPPDVTTWQSFKDKMTKILVDSSRPFDAWTRMFPDQAAAGQMILSKDRAKRMTAVMEQEALRKFLTPAADQIAKIAKKNDWDYRAVKDMVGFWMSQRYAIEKNQDFIRQDTDAATAAYNAMMANPGNAALAKAATKAYKKMHERIAAVNQQLEIDPTDTKLTIGLAGGYNDYTAKKMMSEIEAKIPRAALEKAAKPIYDMMQWKVQRDIANGKVTQQQVSQWFNSPYYVPLTGDPSVDTSEETLFNHGSVNQGSDKRALGRAGSISQNGIDAAVEQVQKSARYHGWRDFKDNLVDMYDSLFNEEKAANPNFTDAEVEGAIMKKYKISIRQEGGPTPVSDTSIIVRKPGVAHRWGENRIYDLHNAEAVDALKSVNKEDVPSSLQHIAYFTRQYARAVTQFLPGFAAINAVRDTWERSENIRTRILPGYTNLNMTKVGRAAVANAANPKLPRKFAGVLAEGTAFANKFPVKNTDPDVVLLREMIANGGTSTVGDYLGATGKDLAKQMADRLGWGRNIMDAVSVWNNSFELISSFSIYKALRNSSVDAKTAAGGVLNMMNFGKQGTAIGPIKALYTFVNPTMQGGHQMIQTLSTKRGKQRAAAYLVGGIALYTMLAGMAGDDDDLGKNKLMSQSNFISERNIQIPFGDDFIKIPIGFGMPQAMWAAAVNIVKAMSGDQSVGESAVEILKGWSRTLAPVAPSETSIADHPIVWLAQTFTPQIGKPLMNVGLDVNTFGGSLTNAKFYKENVSESLQGRKSTAEFWKVVAQDLAQMGIHTYPEVVKEIVRGYAVGPLNEVLKAWVENPNKEKLGRKSVNWAVDRFVSTYDSGSLKERLYYRYRDEMNQAGKRASLGKDLSPREQGLVSLLDSVKKLEGRANGKLSSATKAEKAGNKKGAANFRKLADDIRANTQIIVFRQMKSIDSL